MSRTRKIVVGTAIYLTAVGLGYSLTTSGNDGNDCKGCVAGGHPGGQFEFTDEDRMRAYSSNASKYDSTIGNDECVMGLSLLRWWYLRKATGKVLEVGCGTGRSLKFYSDNAKKIIAIDAVPEMLQEAEKKLANQSNVELRVMDAHKLDFPPQSFDTVVDTFGLCSYEDPVQVLKEMSRVCKKDGKILLMEHGKGSYNWINNLLNNGAERQARTWGCIWNRDIEQLVRDAGLKVASTSRFHFGTTYIIEAQPAERVE